MHAFSIFAGTSNPGLAASVAQVLYQPASVSSVEVFPDGEMTVRLRESVCGRPVFIVQSTSPPVTTNVFELLLFLDACLRADSGAITAVVPYFGYARADKRHARGEPIAASMVARLCESAGLSRLITIDLHSTQIEGFFHIPVDHLSAVTALSDALRDRIAPDTVVVSPDEGRVKMAGEYARLLNLEVAVVHKRRISGTETRVVKVAGDVRDRPCLIIDDMISTGGTINQAVTALLAGGARPEIRVAATHGVLVGDARAKLTHPAVRQILVTDTVAPHHPDWPELEIVSIADLLGTAILRLSAGTYSGDHCS